MFDYYNSEAYAAAIRAATKDSLLYAYNRVSVGSSLQMCVDALTSQAGVAVYTAAPPIDDRFPRQDVQPGWTSGYSDEYQYLPI